jgi:uncharacterized cupredoxin-like copper-binding protein
MKKFLLVASALAVFTTAALAHPNHDSPYGTDLPSPSPSKAPAVRTVQIEIRDAGCAPREIKAARGELLRLVATNKTTRAQDVAVGTAADLKGQAEMIRKFPQMQAAKSSRVSVKPGESAELAWKAAADAVVACDARGEFDATKAAKVVVTAK